MSDNVDYESLQSKTTSISTKKYILTLSPYISSFFSLLITILSLITIFTPFIQLQTFITGEGLSMNISSLYFIHDIYEINEITDTFALPIDMVAGWTIFIIILLSLCLVLAIVTYIFSFKKNPGKAHGLQSLCGHSLLPVPLQLLQLCVPHRGR